MRIRLQSTTAFEADYKAAAAKRASQIIPETVAATQTTATATPTITTKAQKKPTIKELRARAKQALAKAEAAITLRRPDDTPTPTDLLTEAQRVGYRKARYISGVRSSRQAATAAVLARIGRPSSGPFNF